MKMFAGILCSCVLWWIIFSHACNIVKCYFLMQITSLVTRNSCCVLEFFCLPMLLLLLRVTSKFKKLRGFIFLSCLSNAHQSLTSNGIGISLKNFGLKEISVSKILLSKKYRYQCQSFWIRKKSQSRSQKFWSQKKSQYQSWWKFWSRHLVVPKLMPFLRTVVLLGFMSCLPMLMPHL